MKGFITITPASPSKTNGQRSVSVNIRYIVSVGKVDDRTGVITTPQGVIKARESYEEIEKLIEASQD